jgi:hypothetical protein
VKHYPQPAGMRPPGGEGQFAGILQGKLRQEVPGGRMLLPCVVRGVYGVLSQSSILGQHPKSGCQKLVVLQIWT